jgi:hypothetical protein
VEEVSEKDQSKEVFMKDQVKESIKFWWNDSMRKTWRIDLADRNLRNRCFDELLMK